MQNISGILKLRPREVSVLAQAQASRAQYGIEDTLLSPDKGTINAATRMIERGFLTKSKNQTTPPMGLVVKFTEKNRLKMLADAKAIFES